MGCKELISVLDILQRKFECAINWFSHNNITLNVDKWMCESILKIKDSKMNQGSSAILSGKTTDKVLHNYFFVNRHFWLI